MVERLYHPDKYKRVYCDRSRCNKSEICAFFHNGQEKARATKESKAFKKGSPYYVPWVDVNELQDTLWKELSGSPPSQDSPAKSEPNPKEEIK